MRRPPLGIGFSEKRVQLGNLPTNFRYATRRFINRGSVWLIRSAHALLTGFQTFKLALQICPILLKLASGVFAVWHWPSFPFPLSIWERLGRSRYREFSRRPVMRTLRV